METLQQVLQPPYTLPVKTVLGTSAQPALQTMMVDQKCLIKLIKVAKGHGAKDVGYIGYKLEHHDRTYSCGLNLD